MQFDHEYDADEKLDAGLDRAPSEFEKLLSKDMSAAEAMTRAEVDVAISTAKRYPRDTRTAIRRAMEMAGANQEVASEMRYSIPRSGKQIEGPTIRLAEIIGSCWGNIRYDAQVIEEAESYLVARASCHDLESNVQIAVTVRRRISDRNGRRYNDDMIGVTGQAACAIALRNAIFRVIPMGVTRQVYNHAMDVAFGKAQGMDMRRDRAISYFARMGISEERLAVALGVKDATEIGMDQIKTLSGWRNAIHEGEVEMDDVFPPLAPEKAGTSTERLAKRVKKDDPKKEEA